LQVHLADELGFWFVVGYVFTFLFVTIGIFNLIMANFVDYVSTANRRRSQQERGSNALECQNQLKDLLIGLTFKAQGTHRRKSKVEKTCRRLQGWWYRIIHSRTHLQSVARRKSRRLDLEVTNNLENPNLMIRRHEFNQWLHDSKLISCLNKLEINTSNKAELFDTLDSDGSGVLEFEEIIQGLMRMRGPPQKSDIIAALLGVRHVVAVVEDIRAMVERALPGESGAPSNVGVVKAKKVRSTRRKMNGNIEGHELNMENTPHGVSIRKQLDVQHINI